MIENFESKITFEIPTNLDFDKLIRGNNYTLFWQNLHQQQQSASASLGAGAARLGAGAFGMAGAVAAADGGMGGGFGFGGGGGVSGSSATSSLFGGIDYSNGSSDYSLLNSLQSFANRGRDGGMGVGSDQLLDPTYERFIGDVWVGIVLTLMILSSIFCMCSCFLYHKFRQWQRNVLTARSQTLSSMDIETPPPYDVESLPSYTIVSGLPSYQDAIEQLKQKQLKYYEPVRVHRPSVMKLFEAQELLSSAAQAGPVSAPNPQKLEEIRYNFVRPLSVNEMTVTVEGTVPTTSSINVPAEPATTTAQQPSTALPPSSTPPPPYKSQISTISTTSSNTVGVVLMAPQQPPPPVSQHAHTLLPAATDSFVASTITVPELSGSAIRIVPQKKIGRCHYTIENERASGRS